MRLAKNQPTDGSAGAGSFDLVHFCIKRYGLGFSADVVVILMDFF
jgi:hypothetical protein